MKAMLLYWASSCSSFFLAHLLLHLPILTYLTDLDSHRSFLLAFINSKSIADIIRVIGIESFAPQHREALEKAVEVILTDMADRRKLRTERSVDWDEEDREAAIEVGL